jgi:uncharacterized protein
MGAIRRTRLIKSGLRFRLQRALQVAESEGLTQQQFNDRKNDPSKYQLEDPSSNRRQSMSNPASPTTLHRAVMRHSLPEVIQAVSQGEDVDALDREGRTPLFYAAKEGDTEIVAELLKLGSNVNVQDKNQETPLHFAAREYRPEAAELLIRCGADVSIRDLHGNTPLWRAIFESRGRGELIKLLLSAGADKTLKNKHGSSPEDLAKTIGNYDISAFLG